jgi:ribosomal-protein-serine acetyltransferase
LARRGRVPTAPRSERKGQRYQGKRTSVNAVESPRRPSGGRSAWRSNPLRVDSPPQVPSPVVKDVLTDGTITLRTPIPDDAGSHCDAVLESLPDVSRWLEWAHEGYGIEESKGFIARAITGRESGDMYEFHILDQDGKFLGGCGLNRVDRRFLKANLGYWVRTAAAGRGVATAATRLLARYGFEQRGLQRIEIIAAVENRASQRVAEKVGARREGLLRNGIRYRSHNIDAVMFSLIPDDL